MARGVGHESLRDRLDRRNRNPTKWCDPWPLALACWVKVMVSVGRIHSEMVETRTGL